VSVIPVLVLTARDDISPHNPSRDSSPVIPVLVLTARDDISPHNLSRDSSPVTPVLVLTARDDISPHNPSRDSSPDVAGACLLRFTLHFRSSPVALMFGITAGDELNNIFN
jgi:hypothetical protein